MISRVEVAVNSNSPVDDNKADSDGRIDDMSKVNHTVQLLLGNKLNFPKNQDE